MPRDDSGSPDPPAAGSTAGPDARLVQQLREGDAEAGRQFVRDYYPGVYRYLLYLTGRRELAEDLTQETFVQAWCRLETFDGRGALRPWLHRIAHREFLQALRSRHVEVSLEELPEPLAPPAGDPSEAVELRAVMARLPLEEREALVLPYLNRAPEAVLRRWAWLPLEAITAREACLSMLEGEHKMSDRTSTGMSRRKLLEAAGTAAGRGRRGRHERGGPGDGAQRGRDRRQPAQSQGDAGRESCSTRGPVRAASRRYRHSDLGRPQRGGRESHGFLRKAAPARGGYPRSGWAAALPAGRLHLAAVGVGPDLRRAPRAQIRERTREAALAAARRLYPQGFEAEVLAAKQVDAQFEAAAMVPQADQIVPTALDLTIIYVLGASIRNLGRGVHWISSVSHDSWGGTYLSYGTYWPVPPLPPPP